VAALGKTVKKQLLSGVGAAVPKYLILLYFIVLVEPVVMSYKES
jgi:hypothetical protein